MQQQRASERWAPTLGIGANGTAALAFHRGPPQQQQKQQQDDANQMVMAAARDDTLGANCPSGEQFRFLDRLHDKRQLVALILFVEYQAELKYALAVVGLGTHSHLSVENCGGRIGLSSRPSRINNVGWGSVRGGREGRREREREGNLSRLGGGGSERESVADGHRLGGGGGGLTESAA